MSVGPIPGSKRSQLGRGLAALLGETGTQRDFAVWPNAGDNGGPRSVPIEAIRPSPYQPRRNFAEAELEGLAQSIREKGIVQPLLVRPVRDAAGQFELVAGERRWRAAQRVGLHEVPVIVKMFGDADAFEIALVENLQREELSPLEEAEAYNRLTKEFGRGQAGIAEAVGKSRSHVANTLRLLALPDAVRRRLEEGALSAGHARALVGARDAAALAEEIIRRGLNVRATEELLRRRAQQPAMPPPPRERDADTIALEQELGTTLGLRVTLSPRRRGGSLTVHYSSLEQLDRVLGLLRRG